MNLTQDCISVRIERGDYYVGCPSFILAEKYTRMVDLGKKNNRSVISLIDVVDDDEIATYGTGSFQITLFSVASSECYLIDSKSKKIIPSPSGFLALVRVDALDDKTNIELNTSNILEISVLNAYTIKKIDTTILFEDTNISIVSNDDKSDGKVDSASEDISLSHFDCIVCRESFLLDTACVLPCSGSHRICYNDLRFCILSSQSSVKDYCPICRDCIKTGHSPNLETAVETFPIITIECFECCDMVIENTKASQKWKRDSLFRDFCQNCYENS